jgi:hypothetical protein
MTYPLGRIPKKPDASMVSIVVKFRQLNLHLFVRQSDPYRSIEFHSMHCMLLIL